MNKPRHIRASALTAAFAVALTVSAAAETRGTDLVPGTRPGTQDAAEILKRNEARPEQPFVIPSAQDIPVGEAGDLIRTGDALASPSDVLEL